LPKDPAIYTAVLEPRFSQHFNIMRLNDLISFDALWDINRTFIDLFIESFDRGPQELILDFVTTNGAVHGKQLGAGFLSYYDHYCFLPLYVFCGNKLMIAYLGPGDSDNALHVWAILVTFE
jgi:hypothetical protein